MSEEKFIGDLFQRNRKHFSRMPDKATTEGYIDDLFNFLFSSYEGKYETEKKVVQRLSVLKNTFSAIVYDLVRNDEKVNAHVDAFFGRLPLIYQQLLNDAEAILKFDPAAQSIEEVLAAYPGFYATAIYRIAHQLHVQGIKTLPRFFSEYAHSRTGIDIHPGAQIGESLFIDHGTGIVIGETAVIGNNVKIYQGVTLGALNVSKANASSRRHPTIENNVIIYSGATILGGTTVVGHDSIIGGNVWLTYSVPSWSVVYHKSEVKVRDNNPQPEALDFVI